MPGKLFICCLTCFLHCFNFRQEWNTLLSSLNYIMSLQYTRRCMSVDFVINVHSVLHWSDPLDFETMLCGPQLRKVVHHWFRPSDVQLKYLFDPLLFC